LRKEKEVRSKALTFKVRLLYFSAEEEKKARKEFPSQKEAEAHEEANKAFLERVSLGQFCEEGKNSSQEKEGAEKKCDDQSGNVSFTKKKSLKETFFIYSTQSLLLSLL